jgi:hypothetical protein
VSACAVLFLMAAFAKGLNVFRYVVRTITILVVRAKVPLTTAALTGILSELLKYPKPCGVCVVVRARG